MDDFAKVFVEFQDHLAPRLDVYEQAIYLYVLRHTWAIGERQTVVGFKSARKRMAFGIGRAGTPPSEAVVYEKVRSLEQKGCIKVLSSERTGTRIEVVLPSEILGIVPSAIAAQHIDLEQEDFFEAPANRRRILERDGWQCFYCIVKLDENNHVIEHVVSRPLGGNTYRNLVAACRRCNNRKDSESAEDFLRLLYRDGLLSRDDLATRLAELAKLKEGALKPPPALLPALP